MFFSYLFAAFAEEFGVRLAVFAHKELKAWRAGPRKRRVPRPHPNKKKRTKNK